MENALPTLTGSEKQIAWANDIRNTILSEVMGPDKDGVTYTIWTLRQGSVERGLTEQVAAIDKLLATTSASAWIDLRGHSLQFAIQMAHRGGL